MKMTNKMKQTILAAILVITAGSVSADRSDYPYAVNVFLSEGGWGYDILLNGRTIIHQPYIPVITGSYPFKTRIMAEKAGRIMAYKLHTGKAPGLTGIELRSILSVPDR
jgi:hypothetical protein